jgi:hypothetical protein
MRQCPKIVFKSIDEGKAQDGWSSQSLALTESSCVSPCSFGHVDAGTSIAAVRLYR